MSTNDSVFIEKVFQATSAPVKSISFHPTKSLILTGLRSNTIQLWNHEHNILVHQYINAHAKAAHIRSVDFNPDPNIEEFISGGDDYAIILWNYNTHKKLFEFRSHLDYIRNAQYYPNKPFKPWIVSCSDDQTLRLWDYKHKKLICTLTGHNHYTMWCAWHPRNKNILISCSLDQSIYIWDLSKLNDVYENSYDYYLKSILNSSLCKDSSDWRPEKIAWSQSHTRGVNHFDFNPFNKLIVTGSDDKRVGLTLFDKTNNKCYSLDQFVGHRNNVSAVKFIYDPKLNRDMIVSAGEDRCIFVWDIDDDKYWKFPHNRRYWVLESHPKLNLFAAGHDSGFFTFKIIRKPNNQNDDVLCKEYEICTSNNRDQCSTEVHTNTCKYDDLMPAIKKPKVDGCKTWLVALSIINVFCVLFKMCHVTTVKDSLVLTAPVILGITVILVNSCFYYHTYKKMFWYCWVYLKILFYPYFLITTMQRDNVLDLLTNVTKRKWINFEKDVYDKISIDIHCFNIAILHQIKCILATTNQYQKLSKKTDASRNDEIDCCIAQYWKCIEQKVLSNNCVHSFNFDNNAFIDVRNKVYRSYDLKCIAWILMNTYWMYITFSNFIMDVNILCVFILTSMLLLCVGYYTLGTKLYLLRYVYLCHPKVYELLMLLDFNDNMAQNELFYENYKYVLNSAATIQTTLNLIDDSYIAHLIISYLPKSELVLTQPKIIRKYPQNYLKERHFNQKYFKRISQLTQQINKLGLSYRNKYTQCIDIDSSMFRNCTDEMIYNAN